MKIIIILFTILFLTSTNIFSQFPQTYSRSTVSNDAIIAITSDASNNIYVTGVSYDLLTNTSGIVTIKYDQNGNQLWTPPPFYENAFPKAMTIDDNGNIYIAGGYSNGSNSDFFVISYNSSGSVRHGWPRMIDNSGDDQATSLVLADGKIYVTGFSYVGHLYGANYDMLTVAYDAIGNEQWRNNFDLDDQIYAPGHGNDFAYAIDAYTGDVFDNAIFICGKSWLGTQYGDAYITVQINTVDGSQYWYSFYKYDEGGQPGDAGALAIAVSQSTGNVYTTGYKTKPGGPIGPANLDCITMQNHWGLFKGSCGKPPGMGHECEDWCASYVDEDNGGCGSGHTDYGVDMGKSISIVDADSYTDIQIFVTGYTHTAYHPLIGYYPANGSDYLVLKYLGTAPGNVCDPEHYLPVNIFTRDGSANEDDNANSICTDANGNVYVTGGSKENGSGRDIVTLKLSNNLSLLTTSYFNGSENAGDEGMAVKTSGTYVYAGGTTNILPFNNNIADYVTLQYNTGSDNQNLSFVAKGLNVNTPKTFNLSQNYPNPFNPSTVITYSIPKKSIVNLKIYNVLGQEIASLINNELKQPGFYNVRFDASNLPSGLYLYKLTAGDYSEVKKMLLIK